MKKSLRILAIVVAHLIFWFLTRGMAYFGVIKIYGAENAIVPIIADLLSFMVVVYFNLFYLIPCYLYKAKYWQYGFSILMLFLVTFTIRTGWVYFSYELFLNPGSSIGMTYVLKSQIPIILFVMFVSMAMQLGIDWFRQKSNNSQLEIDKLNAEIQFLRTQVNPHFMFNTLNNLYALTLKKSEQAPEVVLKLSEMLRYMLYECNEPRVSLQQELQYLDNYITLEKLRLNREVDIRFSKKGNMENVRIAPLLLLPFVENAFKYGSRGQGFKFIHMNVETTDDRLYFFCKNGHCAQRPTLDQPGGLGISNVRRRLNLLYPQRHHLSIGENNNDFEVSLTLYRS